MGKLIKAAAVTSAVTAIGVASAAPISGQGTWESTLQVRDLNRDGVTDAFYDTRLDITWLRAGSVNKMDWQTARNWAKADRFGMEGWRLPTMMDTGPVGCDYANADTDCGYNVLTQDAAGTVYSEMASLFYDTLGNKALVDTSGAGQSGWGLTNTGNFQNLQALAYWTGLPNGGAWYWYFNSFNMGQYFGPPASELYALAVHDGDVGALPEPASLALVGAALVGLVATRRRSATVIQVPGGPVRGSCSKCGCHRARVS